MGLAFMSRVCNIIFYFSLIFGAFATNIFCLQETKLTVVHSRFAKVHHCERRRETQRSESHARQSSVLIHVKACL